VVVAAAAAAAAAVSTNPAGEADTGEKRMKKKRKAW